MSYKNFLQLLLIEVVIKEGGENTNVQEVLASIDFWTVVISDLFYKMY